MSECLLGEWKLEPVTIVGIHEIQSKAIQNARNRQIVEITFETLGQWTD